MSLNEFIAEVVIFCEKKTQELIAELQENRFENQGEFNDHQKWVDNDDWKGRKTKSVQADKGRNEPLVDTGVLKSELTNPINWDLEPKFSEHTLTLTIPDRENFTDSKYDKLDTGGATDTYTSPRGNTIEIKYVPPRPFKDISAQDVDWIKERLIEEIKTQFGGR